MTIPQRFRTIGLGRVLTVLAGAACGLAPSAQGQSDLWQMPAAVTMQLRSAGNPQAEALLRRIHAQCVAERKDDDGEKATSCIGVLGVAFAQAQQRGMPALRSWALDQIAAASWDPLDQSSPQALLTDAAKLMSRADYPLSLPLHAAYVEDALKRPPERSTLDQLIATADRYDEWGYPATELRYTEGAATLARRIEGAQSPLAQRMDARGLRALVMLGDAEGNRRCASAPAAGIDPAVMLNMRVSCAIATENAGRWREAEARLRALLPEAQGIADPLARSDVLIALGRNLIRQQLWDDAAAYLASAKEILDPLRSKEPSRGRSPIDVRAARAQASLNIAVGFRDGQPSGGDSALNPGAIYALESRIAGAETWELTAEQLQRDIDAGRLKWEGGVWQSLLGSYRDASADVRRLYGPEATILGSLQAKEIEAGELFVTEGFRRPLQRDNMEADRTKGMNDAIRMLARLPVTNQYRIEGLKVASAFLARNRRDVPQSRSLCQSAMRGAIDRLNANAEYDRAAQAQARRRAPLFAQCVKTAWLAATPGT